jgi:hypothetical protein
VSVTTAQRNTLAALMDWSVAHAALIHYPPIVGGRIIRTQSVGHIRSADAYKAQVLSREGAVWDCSQNVYALLCAIGCRVRFPEGATGSLLDELPHYHDPRAAFIGAVCVYGPAPGHHATMTRRRDARGGNPVQYSQGKPSDPRFVRLLDEAAFQPNPFTMLSIAHL